MQTTSEINNDSEESQLTNQSRDSGIFNAEPQTSGLMLKKKRLEVGINIEEVSEKLNLSTSMVEAIENDVWERLPEVTYVRGYIRSYASLLGIDSADVLMGFKHKHSDQSISLDTMPRGLEEPAIGLAAMPRWVKISLCTLVFGGFVVYLLSDSITDLLNKNAEPVERITLDNNSVPAADDNSSSTQAVSTDEISEEPSAIDNGKRVALGADASTEVAADKVELLELTFVGTSWVDIRDQDGEKLIYKSFPPGESVKVMTKLPINVFIGNADAVNMSYQGQTIDLQAHKEEVYAKFALSE